jgi:hypothetical protein
MGNGLLTDSGRTWNKKQFRPMASFFQPIVETQTQQVASMSASVAKMEKE